MDQVAQASHHVPRGGNNLICILCFPKQHYNCDLEVMHMVHGVWDYAFHSVNLESAEQSKFFLQKTNVSRIQLH